MAVRSVYVSSTFRDLKDLRSSLNDTIRRMNLLDVAMEHYNAEPGPALDVCVQDVGACDVYVGVFAWRYGDVPEGQTRSVTEAEYRAAKAAGKPCLIFLLHEDAPWPRSQQDRDPTRIEALREELTRDHTVKYFGLGQQLPELVATALHQWILENAGDETSSLGLLDPALLTGYYKRLDQEYGGLDLAALTPPEHDDGLPVRLQTVFVQPDVRVDPPPVEVPRELLQRLQIAGELDEMSLPDGVSMDDLRAAQQAYRDKPRRPVLPVVMAERCLVVLGDPGAGKSTLARMLVLDLITPGSPWIPSLAGHLPVLVELREYAAARARGQRSVLDFIEEKADSGLGLTRSVLEGYLRAEGPALVVFDGLDEVFEPAERAEITRQIAGFAERHPSARVLVTSRTWGYERRRLAAAGFAHHTLQDLERGQIEQFLTGWYQRVLGERPQEAAHRRDHLIQVIDSSRPILELAGNPLLLTVLAIIGKGQQLPRERWKAYEQATRVLVENWDVSRHLRDRQVETNFITEDDKRELLRRLAWNMQTGAFGKAGNFVHRDELQKLFEDYLVNRYRQSPAQAKAVAVAMIDQFRHRDFVLSRWGPDLYAFVHRAFLEFFCADAVLQQFQHAQTMTLDELGDLYVARRDDPTWREILRLLVSQLAETHVAKLLRRLLDADRPWEDTPHHFWSPEGLRLAVECLPEVRNLQGAPEMADVAGAVLAEIILLLECYGDGQNSRVVSLLHTASSVATDLGPGWPGREIYADWFSRRGGQLLGSALLVQTCELLDSLYEDRPPVVLAMASVAASRDRRAVATIRRLTEDSGSTVSTVSAGQELDPAQRSALLAQARHDDHWPVRMFALVMLDHTDPEGSETDALLRERLENDSSGEVFGFTVRALLRRHPGQDDVVQAAVGRAVAESRSRPVTVYTPAEQGETFIEVVADALEPECPGHPVVIALRVVDGVLLTDPDQILALLEPVREGGDLLTATLRFLADSSFYYETRHNALALLDALFPQDPDTEAMLYERMTNDPDDDVFALTVKAVLRRGMRERPAVLRFVVDRVVGMADDTNLRDRFVKRASELVLSAGDMGLPLLLSFPERGPYFLDIVDDDLQSRLEPVRRLGDPEQVVAGLHHLAGTSAVNYLRHNALLLLDTLLPQDAGVEATLRDRVLNDPDRLVFGVAVDALHRRSRDPRQVSALVMERAAGLGLGTGFAARAADTLEPDDPGHPLVLVHADGILLEDEADLGARVQHLRQAPDPDAAQAALLVLAGRAEDGWARHNALLLLDRLESETPGLKTLLRDRLAEDDSGTVVALAASMLLRRCPDERAELLTVLSGRIGPDRSWEAAAQVLAAYEPDHPMLFAYAEGHLIDDGIDSSLGRLREAAGRGPVVAGLRTLALGADAAEHRHNALMLLDQLSPADPEVEALLRDRLHGDPDATVLELVAGALLRRHPDQHRELLETVRNRALAVGIDDPLRSAAARFLAAHDPHVTRRVTRQDLGAVDRPLISDLPTLTFQVAGSTF
ncbi:DUF4062 domain-containing protein [Kineosporia sp. J2-2]|uniref:DUF4062 domain-containing protein n=1 Tax=Kineosporia corallincola TaxID=2835133 RepID=A0ABS5TB37_9ACTN|nr:DUF4062 domain-containing protein [Kineosporia corallincola]MBT0768271.1 DUF4062 domain-containing protein [Kineosporia corallincola]